MLRIWAGPEQHTDEKSPLAAQPRNAKCDTEHGDDGFAEIGAGGLWCGFGDDGGGEDPG